MMRDDAWEIYESWRRLWLSGCDSNAIAALRFHGLRSALAMVGGVRNRTCPRTSPSSSALVELSVTDAVIAEAASQVRHLMRVSPASVIAVLENEGNHHV